MRYFIKIVILLILSSFIASALVVCAPNEVPSGSENTQSDKAENQNAETTAAEKILPELPDANYNGDTFTFLDSEYDANGYWGSYDIYAAEETGDPINDAVFRRNRTVEEKLNINISEFRTTDIAGLAVKNITAGDAVYDCAMPRMGSAASMASKGYLLSFDKLPYINLEKPWWAESVNSMLTIGKRIFFIIGDLSVMDKDSIFIFMFNKKVASNAGGGHQYGGTEASDSGIENLYGLVKDNKWTLDKFHSIIKMVSMDLNGDGELGFNDLIGLVSSDFAINVLYYNTGETVTRKDAEDYPYFTMNNERGVTAAEKAFGIITDKSAAILADALEKSGIANPWTDGINKMFQEDRALFLLAQITFIHRTRTMESDFGILPSPKLNEAQEQYYTSLNAVVSNCITVPVTVTDKEKTSAVIEALTAESRYTLIPAYYDITITNKIMRDEESGEMLDIILSTRVCDLGFVFNWGGLGNLPLSLYPKGGSFASEYEKRETKAVTEMEKTIEIFKNLEV